MQNTPPPAEAGNAKPEPTWFFERGDGKVFACGESEAWGILHNRNNWMRRDFTLLGQSDGTRYFKTIKDAARELPEKRASRDKLASDAARYRQTEDRLRFQELRGDDDEQVRKVTAILADLDAKIAGADAELSSWSRVVEERAFAAELKVAKKNGPKPPRNMDVISPVEANREQILANIGRR